MHMTHQICFGSTRTSRPRAPRHRSPHPAGWGHDAVGTGPNGASTAPNPGVQAAVCDIGSRFSVALRTRHNGLLRSPVGAILCIAGWPGAGTPRMSVRPRAPVRLPKKTAAKVWHRQAVGSRLDRGCRLDEWRLSHVRSPQSRPYRSERRLRSSFTGPVVCNPAVRVRPHHHCSTPGV